MNKEPLSLHVYFQRCSRRSAPGLGLMVWIVALLIMASASDHWHAILSAAQPINITASDFWTGGVTLQSKV